MSIDPDEKVTPSHYGDKPLISSHDEDETDIAVVNTNLEGIAVLDIGLIPPPPMFSSPCDMDPRASLPPPDDDDDCSGLKQETVYGPIWQLLTRDVFSDSEAEDLYEPFEDQIGVDARLVQTVPAKEPQFDAVPLKSALKKGAKAGPEGKFQENTSSTILKFVFTQFL